MEEPDDDINGDVRNWKLLKLVFNFTVTLQDAPHSVGLLFKLFPVSCLGRLLNSGESRSTVSQKYISQCLWFLVFVLSKSVSPTPCSPPQWRPHHNTQFWPTTAELEWHEFTWRLFIPSIPIPEVPSRQPTVRSVGNSFRFSGEFLWRQPHGSITAKTHKLKQIPFVLSHETSSISAQFQGSS